MLDVLCNDEIVDNRVAAADVIGKMMNDKLTGVFTFLKHLKGITCTGPRWTRAMVQYMPAIFADACRDSSRTAINLFDTNAENPELIWSDESRDAVRKGIAIEQNQLHSQAGAKNAAAWKVCWKWGKTLIQTQCFLQPPTKQLYAHTAGDDHVIIGGVYVRVFVQQPTWTLRGPRHFLSELVSPIFPILIQYISV